MKGSRLMGQLLHKLLKGKTAGNLPSKRHRLQEGGFVPDRDFTACGLQLQRDPLPFPMDIHIIAVQIQMHHPTGRDLTLHMKAIHATQPAIRLNLGWSRGKLRQLWEGRSRRTVATTQRLIGTLLIVMLDPTGGGRTSLLKGIWPIHRHAFLLIGAMIAFHETIFLRMARSTDMHLDAQRPAKAQESRREITARRRSYRAGITIQGDTLGQTQLLDGVPQGEQQGLCREIGAHLAIQQDRGSFIHNIESFGDMLLFAGWRKRLSNDGTDVLEIDLPALHGGLSWQFLLGRRIDSAGDALIALENPIDGTC